MGVLSDRPLSPVDNNYLWRVTRTGKRHMSFALSSFLILAGVGIVAALVGGYLLVERPRKNRERIELALLKRRGPQTASAFALLFDNESERRVAEKLHPELQMLTVTKTVPLRPDDLLCRGLRIDDEELVYAVDKALVECGCKKPNTREWSVAFNQKVSTVGELVRASSRLLTTPHEANSRSKRTD